MVWTLSAKELELRQRRVRDELGRRELGGLCLFSPTYIYYLSGFAFIQTERPIGLAFPRSGRSLLFLPRLEEEHAREHARVDGIEAYAEYPGRVHPMRRFAEICGDLGLASAGVGDDSDGYGGGYGYQGPKLSELLRDAKITSIRSMID